MSRAILDYSASTPQATTGGFADLEPLDQELASQLPAWDLVPPHAFLVRKPRKPKPVVLPQPPVEVAPSEPVVVESTPVEQEPVIQAPAIEIEADPTPLTAVVHAEEASVPETVAEVEAEPPVTYIETEAAASLAVHAENCGQCGVSLEPDSAFCPECGHKQ